MEKYKVIGWTDYADERYPEIGECNQEKWDSVELAIINSIRENGYMFCGDQHQYHTYANYRKRDSGIAPVLNSGERVCFSQRGWGALMAKALMYVDKDCPDMPYLGWYVTGWGQKNAKRIKYVYPPRGVNRSLIVEKGTLFDTSDCVKEREISDKEYIKKFPQKDIENFSRVFCDPKYRIIDDLPDNHPYCIDMKLKDEPFNQILGGEKTIEIRLFDKKRSKIKVGDYIQFAKTDTVLNDVIDRELNTFSKFKYFEDGESDNRIRVEVVKIHTFRSFKEMFKTKCKDEGGFSGYDIQQAIDSMRCYYSAEDEEKYGVVGIEFKICKKQ